MKENFSTICLSSIGNNQIYHNLNTLPEMMYHQEIKSVFLTIVHVV